MLQTLKNRKNEGFTIIEVLIVLAIAGLILLVVLLAVPALQRNSRNTSMKSDAAAVAGGISEFESNNEGVIPNSATGTGTITVAGATGTSTTAKTQGGTVVTTITSVPAAPTATAPSPAIGTISVWFGQKCEKAGVFTPGTPGDVSTRSAAVYYTIESANITQQKCVDA